MATKRPNFLIIMADFMGALTLPAYGNPVAKTPAISALAENSAVFRNAYCNFPLCVPSRASMMTGLLPATIGAYDNGAEFASHIPTFAHYLRRMGYRCELSGKIHFIGPDQLHDFDERLTTDIVPADYGWMPPWGDHIDTGWPSLEPIREAGIAKRTLGMDFDEEVAYRAIRRIYDFARDPDTRPFLLTASFIEPHEPYKTPKAFWDLYDDADIGPPNVGMLDQADWDAHSARLCKAMGLDSDELTAEEIVRARHGFYSMLSFVDRKVGEILSALKETGLDDNTVVIVTADHGSMIGERGLWGILCFYEWAMRVPFIIHAPNRIAPRTIDTNISLVDLMPTLLDLATDGNIPELARPIEGESVVPFALGTRDGGGRSVHAELFAESCVSPQVMVRRGNLKYIHCENDPPLLFDLASDPDERINLAVDPDYGDTMASLREEVRGKWDLAAWEADARQSRNCRSLIYETYEMGNPPVWDYAVDNDPWRHYQRSFREPWQDTEEKAVLK